VHKRGHLIPSERERERERERGQMVKYPIYFHLREGTWECYSWIRESKAKNSEFKKSDDDFKPFL